MKTIHDPDKCPVCDYARIGLEPSLPCPECGVALLPGAPVFDFSIRGVRWIGVGAGVAMLGVGILIVNSPLPAREVLAVVYIAVAASLAWVCWRFAPIRLRSIFAKSDLLFVRNGRVCWRIPYEGLEAWKGGRMFGMVILRDRAGKLRALSARTRDQQNTIIAAIDDAIARYRMDNEVKNAP